MVAWWCLTSRKVTWCIVTCYLYTTLLSTGAPRHTLSVIIEIIENICCNDMFHLGVSVPTDKSVCLLSSFLWASQMTNQCVHSPPFCEHSSWQFIVSILLLSCGYSSWQICVSIVLLLVSVAAEKSVCPISSFLWESQLTIQWIHSPPSCERLSWKVSVSILFLLVSFEADKSVCPFSSFLWALKLTSQCVHSPPSCKHSSWQICVSILLLLFSVPADK